MSSSAAQQGPSACIISGGSAANEILEGFTSCFHRVSFCLPVSDNGGSSAEIIRQVRSHCGLTPFWLMACDPNRVLGGPSVGERRRADDGPATVAEHDCVQATFEVGWFA